MTLFAQIGGVSELDASLDLRLFERGGLVLKLIKTGRVLYKRTGALLTAIEETAHAIASGGHRPRGPLRISAPLLFSQAAMGKLAAGFALKHPEVRLEVTTEDRAVPRRRRISARRIHRGRRCQGDGGKDLHPLDEPPPFPRAIYTVPFGQIGVVNNQSRDWAIVKLEFLVDFETDLRLVKQIVRGIQSDIAADEELGKTLLAPLKFQGVRRMEPYGMVVGIKFTVIPGQQFVLRREIYARVRDEFAKADIHFARPRVEVQSATGATEPEAQEAAALTAVSQSSTTTADSRRNETG